MLLFRVSAAASQLLWTTQVIENHMTALNAVLAKCTDLKGRVETERVAVTAITTALVDASETLVRRGWMTPQKVQGLTLSMEENALDLNAALDEVDASIRTAIGPVEIFAQATERMRLAQESVQMPDGQAATDRPNAAEPGFFDLVAAQYSALCENLLTKVRELAEIAAHRLDDLREKIDRLQSSFGEITAAMDSPHRATLH
jgi:hypothetical protein